MPVTISDEQYATLLSKSNELDRISATCMVLSKEEYEEFLRDQEKLQFLEDFGVDNWQGYEDAMREMEESHCD